MSYCHYCNDSTDLCGPNICIHCQSINNSLNPKDVPSQLFKIYMHKIQMIIFDFDDTTMIHQASTKGNLKQPMIMKKTFFTKCYLCGDKDDLIVDRMQPILQYKIVSNYRPCCKKCKKLKGNYPFIAFIHHIRKIVETSF